MNKGFTYVEMLIVLALLMIIGAIIFTVLRTQTYFARARDLQRLNDLQSLFSALQIYLKNSSEPDLDGPYLDFRGIDEVWASVFISVPLERQTFSSSTCLYQGKPYVILQADVNNYKNLNGRGWLPIDFSNILSLLPFSSLPVDPINNYQKGFYYLYAFKRQTGEFELSAMLESKEMSFGGINDRTSTDNGNDPYRFEIGTNLNIIPPFPTSTSP